jgi:hypothetical protein
LLERPYYLSILAEWTHNKSSDVRELLLGGKQIWALKDSNYGAIEFRLRVDENRVSGYWAGPFGKNGKVIGTFKQ